MQFTSDGVEMIDHTKPKRVDSDGDSNLFIAQQRGQTGAVRMSARQHKLRAHGRHRERQAPCIGVEHGHRRQHHLAVGKCDGIGLEYPQRVQVVATMGVEHALGWAGRAGGVAEPSGNLFVKLAPCDRRTALLEQRFKQP